jgi:hypothetical protein
VASKTVLLGKDCLPPPSDFAAPRATRFPTQPQLKFARAITTYAVVAAARVQVARL